MHKKGVNSGMPRDKNKFLKCIYKIYFLNDNRIYVGSSMRWPYRKSEHIRHLKQNKHHNIYLQRTFNRLGANNLQIEPVEFVNTYEELLLAEQKWITYFHSTDKEKGFNLVKDVTKNGTVGYRLSFKQRQHISSINRQRMMNPEEREKISKTIQQRIKETNGTAYGGKFVAKTFSLYSPKGIKIQIYNLNKFCRDNQLNYQKMARLVSGRLIEYQGWKLHLQRRNLVKKIFILLSPQNERVEVYGLRQFCLKNNIHYKTMLKVYQGKGISANGWKKYGECVYHKGKTYQIQFPSGDIKKINNLKHFCEQNKISYNSLRKTKRTQGFFII